MLLNKIITICRKLPNPTHSAGELRFYHHIRFLNKSCKKLLIFVEKTPKQIPAFFRAHHILPLSKLRQNLSEVRLAFVEFWFMGRVIPLLKAHSIPVILDTVDLEFVRRKRESRFVKSIRHDKKKEIENYKKADVVLVASPEDKQALQKYHSRIEVLPLIHKRSEKIHPFNKRKHICFVGSYKHFPNVDGLRWYKEKIYPSVSHLPHVFIGHKAPPDLRKLKGFLGGVKDARNYLKKARLSIAPLRYGAGLKGKIGESIACGTPVITTPIGAEGFRAKHEKNMWIAKNEKEFINGILQTYHDKHHWTRLSKNGLQSCRQFAPNKIHAKLERIIKKLT